MSSEMNPWARGSNYGSFFEPSVPALRFADPPKPEPKPEPAPEPAPRDPKPDVIQEPYPQRLLEDAMITIAITLILISLFIVMKNLSP